MKLSLAPVKALGARAKGQVQANPIIASQLIGFGCDLAVGFGLPVTPDFKLATVGMVTTMATLFGHSQVVPISKLVAGEITQSAAGEPVTIKSPDGSTTTVGGTA